MVIAVPLPRLIQGHDEQIGLIQFQQDVVAARALGLAKSHGIAERRAKAVQDGRFEQKVLHVGRLPLKNLFDQVVQDVAMAAGKGLHQPVHVVVTSKRQGRQVQSGDPPFGAPLQSNNVGRREIELHLSRSRSAVSCSENTRSACRISTICPRARQRASGSGGSSRVVRTRCNPPDGGGGRCSRRKASC